MKIKKRLSAVDVLFWVGVVLIATGVVLLCGIPPGLLVAGGFCLIASYLSDRGSAECEEPEREDPGGDIL